MAPLKTVTPEQMKMLRRLLEDGLDNKRSGIGDMSSEDVQMAISNGSIIQSELCSLVRRVAAMGHYADEETPRCEQPRRVTLLKSLGEQVAILREKLVGLDCSYDEEFANWFSRRKRRNESLLAVAWSGVTARQLLDLLPFPVKHPVDIMTGYSKASRVAMDRLYQIQGGRNIVLVPTNMGIAHDGRSYMRTRVCLDRKRGEYILGLYEMASLLITHPDVLTAAGTSYCQCDAQIGEMSGGIVRLTAKGMGITSDMDEHDFCAGTRTFTGYCNY